MTNDCVNFAIACCILLIPLYCAWQPMSSLKVLWILSLRRIYFEIKLLLEKKIYTNVCVKLFVPGANNDYFNEDILTLCPLVLYDQISIWRIVMMTIYSLKNLARKKINSNRNVNHEKDNPSLISSFVLYTTNVTYSATISNKKPMDRRQWRWDL